MEANEWMARFKVTHQKAKAGQLSESEHKAYLDMREELARSLVAAQSLVVPEGAPARRHFRVAQLYAIELANTYKTMTKAVSRAGFSAVLPSQMKVGEEVSFTMALGRDGEPLTGKAKVVGATKQGGWLISFSIEVMSEPNAERLETALFDAVLARFK